MPPARTEKHHFVGAHLKTKQRKKFEDRELKRSQQAVSADTKHTRRIIDEAKAQMLEIEEEELPHQTIQVYSDSEVESNADFEDFDNDDDFDIEGEEVVLSPEDQDTLDYLMPEEVHKRQSFSRLIQEKLQQDSDEPGKLAVPPKLTPKVVDVFSKVGILLARYKSGKLPKAFKIIPSLANWEDVLYLTEPENWTPNAVFAATRMFASNLKPRMAQRFFNLILLDHVRSDLETRSQRGKNAIDRRLINPHLYEALKKAIYKPGAWFKGILLPLCGIKSPSNPNQTSESPCTLREALVISSVLKKCSVPVLHSAAAIMKLASIEQYNGAISIFMKTLLDKKYALPFRVIDNMVSHFLMFRSGIDASAPQMPVLWHQCMLVFCQRYKEDMIIEQKEALLELIKVQTHHAISAEVRRELQNSTCRGYDVAMVQSDHQS